MSQNALNTFNISIYQELLKRYDYGLRQMKKYNMIYDKMRGYYTAKDIKYIMGVYKDDLIDIINSNLFSLFVPDKVKKDILKFIPIIESTYLQKHYDSVIDKFEKIKSMFFITINP